MKTGTKTLIGAVAWIAFVIAARCSPASAAWLQVMLTFAALVVFPLAIDLVSERRDAGGIARSMKWVRHGQLPAAALLAISCGMRPGLGAMLVATPWAALTALLASVGFGRMLRDKWSRPIDRLSADVGMIFVVIGGVWMLADRGGLRPVELPATMVAVIAVHFHFAGLLLPIFSGFILRQIPDSRFASRAAVGIVLGVPAMAIAMAGTHFGWNPAIEAAAASGLAISAMAAAVLQIRLALDASDSPVAARVLLIVSGASLFFAVLFGGAYSLRGFAHPLPWLGLPQMRALHGTLAAVGFALCGALGWKLHVPPGQRAAGGGRR